MRLNNSMRNKVGSAVIGGASVIGLLLGFAGTAHAGDGDPAITAVGTRAAYGCSGALIDTYQTNWGQVRLYYSSAEGGTNCASLVAQKYAGQRHYMCVGIRKGSLGQSCAHGQPNTKSLNTGYFEEYAGPVKVTHVDNACISLNAAEDSPAGPANGYDTPIYNVHCG
jgi:hypothetical protein